MVFYFQGRAKEDYENLKKEHENLQLKCAQLQDDNFKRVRKKEMQMHATFDEIPSEMMMRKYVSLLH